MVTESRLVSVEKLSPEINISVPPPPWVGIKLSTRIGADGLKPVVWFFLQEAITANKQIKIGII